MSPARKKKTTKKSTSRKSTPRKGGKKKTTKKKAKKKAAKKKTTKKKAKKKAAKKKTTKKKATTQKKAAAKKKSERKAAKKKTTKKGKKKAAAEPEPAPPPKPKEPGKLVVARGKLVSKLGVRWSCWACQAVFYDLNQPQAVCPKCGQNQAQRPHAEIPEKKPPKRDSMRALRVLDDDDSATTTNDADTDPVEMDLELGTDEKLLDETEEDDSDDD